MDTNSQHYVDIDLQKMVDFGVPTKKWIAAGPEPCSACLANQDQGYIPLKNPFVSGHNKPLAHDGCHCYLEAGEIDLDSVDLFSN